MIISEKNKQEFKRIFKVPLNNYYDLVFGFKLFKFLDAYVPNHMLVEVSSYDLIKETWGENAAELIERILKENANSNYPDNSEHISEVDVEANYLIALMRMNDIVAHEQVTGKITYPFGLRQVDKKWTIDHLPSGFSIRRNLGKIKAIKLFNLLVEDFSEALLTANYTQETYDTLKVIVDDF